MPKLLAKYDVIIIGAGPAGYVSAVRCGQLGLKTACIDSLSDKFGRPSLGGAYLNAGCVASMALLESAKLYHALTVDLAQHGIRAENIALDVGQMIRRKDRIVAEINSHIAGLFSHHKIDHIHARARLLQAGHVEVVPVDGGAPSCLIADHIILATGSAPLELPFAPIDHEYIIDTSDALNLDSVPKRLAIIGAGIKGLEIASIWNRLGSEVILLEAQESFLNLPDQQISREAYAIFTGQGMEMRLGARVISAKKGNQEVMIKYQDHEGSHALSVDRLIVAIGRKPSSEGLAAPEADLLLDDSGYVHVDENCRTNLPGVYAIGDLTLLGPMLAHKGIEEGVFVAEQIAGLQSMINYDLLPSVVYTEPEIAWVGQTEQTLRGLGEPLKIGVFPFSASSRALAIGRSEGLVKIIAHAETDRILGVHMIGAGASELIAEAVLAMEFSASSEDLARTIHAHPTLSEALYEGALALRKMALHLPMGK
ncbi:dihydrolipoyl dehydrogenase [Methylomicrobium lacus]|uniref:dihydrolipoyl dehydrogenase n=1 Tax=Methylomicrobium lacus TaxID=136992 RepID=UPI0035A88307